MRKSLVVCLGLLAGCSPKEQYAQHDSEHVPISMPTPAPAQVHVPAPAQVPAPAPENELARMQDMYDKACRLTEELARSRGTSDVLYIRSARIKKELARRIMAAQSKKIVDELRQRGGNLDGPRDADVDAAASQILDLMSDE